MAANLFAKITETQTSALNTNVVEIRSRANVLSVVIGARQIPKYQTTEDSKKAEEFQETTAEALVLFAKGILKPSHVRLELAPGVRTTSIYSPSRQQRLEITENTNTGKTTVRLLKVLHVTGALEPTTGDLSLDVACTEYTLEGSPPKCTYNHINPRVRFTGPLTLFVEPADCTELGIKSLEMKTQLSKAERLRQLLTNATESLKRKVANTFSLALQNEMLAEFSPPEEPIVTRSLSSRAEQIVSPLARNFIEGAINGREFEKHKDNGLPVLDSEEQEKLEADIEFRLSAIRIWEHVNVIEASHILLRRHLQGEQTTTNSTTPILEALSAILKQITETAITPPFLTPESFANKYEKSYGQWAGSITLIATSSYIFELANSVEDTERLFILARPLSGGQKPIKITISQNFSDPKVITVTDV